MKGGAHGVAKEFVARNLKNAEIRFSRIYETEDSVVRANEKLIACLDYQGSPVRADSRIDDSKMDRSCWKIVITRAESESPCLYVLCRNVVGEIENLCFRIDCENDALDGRNEIV